MQPNITLRVPPHPTPAPNRKHFQLAGKMHISFLQSAAALVVLSVRESTTQTGGARKQTELNAVQHLPIPLNASDKSKCCSKTPVALTVAAPVVSHHSFKTALGALE